MLLAQDDMEFGVIDNLTFLVFGSEDEHNAVLKEVVELDRIGVQTLTIKVVDPEANSQSIEVEV